LLEEGRHLMKAWRALLAKGDDKKIPRRRFWALKKGKEPFLYLPENGSMARVTLDLYPAQKLKARAFLRLVRALIPLGLPVLASKMELPIDPEAKFVAFLRKLGSDPQNIPLFGVLEGYVQTADRRYILLLFNSDHRPSIIVKVGVTPQAKELIRLEQDFFFPTRTDLPGVPEPLDLYREEDAYAIAYPYEAGSTPTYAQKAELEKVLSPWIEDGPPIPMSEFPKWRELEILQETNPGLRDIFDVLRDVRVCPVFSHGDFAAWNIRVSPQGEWRVLDWERGCRHDFPAWDWFNYVVQYHLLVLHSSADKIVSELEAIWADPGFLAYADRTGIRGILKELALGHLVYMERYHSFPDQTKAWRVITETFRKRHFSSVARSTHPRTGTMTKGDANALSSDSHLARPRPD
jgi:hypothetical protein